MGAIVSPDPIDRQERRARIEKSSPRCLHGTSSRHSSPLQDCECYERPTRSHLGRELVLGTVLATLLAVFFRTFLVQGFKVPSRSMEPGLQPGDHVLVNKLIYGQGPDRLPFLPYRDVRRGDVVVFKSPTGGTLVKRCLGLPGDRLEVDRKRARVGGRRSVEPESESEASEAPPTHLQIAEDHYYFLGDSTEISIDSRDFGPVPKRALVGRGFLIYWSIESEVPEIWDTMPSSRRSLGGWFSDWRWHRIGKLIH